MSRCSDGRILGAEQLLGLRGPRQQLAVESKPSRLQLLPEAGRLDRSSDAIEERILHPSIGEELPARPGVDDAGALSVAAEALSRELGRATDDDDRARAHVLLLADHARNAVATEGIERLSGVLEQRAAVRRRDRR